MPPSGGGARARPGPTSTRFEPLTAAAAGAAQQHVVALDPHAEPIREPADRPLEARVVESDEPPAVLADEMTVVLPVRLLALEPRLPVADLDALDSELATVRGRRRGDLGGPRVQLRDPVGAAVERDHRDRRGDVRGRSPLQPLTPPALMLDAA